MIASVYSVLSGIAIGGWLGIAALSCFGVYRQQRGRKAYDVPPDLMRAAVIIPVRGVPPNFDQLWSGLCNQSYPSYRIIFAIESQSEPIHELLLGLRGGPTTHIVVAGSTTRRSQKIHNMLAAMRTLESSDEFVVFADADIVPDRHWLIRLLHAQNTSDREVTTGYRWILPTDDRWVTAFVCAINSSAIVGRLHPFDLVWGGSMAMHRNAIAGLQLEREWDRASLDDLTVSRAVSRVGGRVHSPRDAWVRSPASYTWRQAIAFGRRQYLFIRLHRPWHWSSIAAVVTIPLIGWTLAIPLMLGGNTAAIGAVVIANALDFTRGVFRSRIPKKLWNVKTSGKVAVLDRFGTPLWLLVNAVVVWSTLFGRRIDWAGRSYYVDGRGDVLQIVTEA